MSRLPITSAYLAIQIVVVAANKEFGWTFFESTLVPPHESLHEDLTTGSRLLISGGPGNPWESSKAAFQLPQSTLFEHLTVDMMEDVKHGLRYIFQTKNNVTLPLAGTGSTGMQTVLDNLVEPGDTVLVPVNGLWSERALSIVSRLGGVPIAMNKTYGEAFYTTEIEAKIFAHKPKIVFHVMGETSTGVYQQIEGLGEVCEVYGCLLVVEVCHTLGMQPFFMDKWKVDAVYANVQKGIGAPVGLVALSFGARAVAKAMTRVSKPRMYVYDMKIWFDRNYWNLNPGKAQQFLHSYPILLTFTLREALARMSREGLVNAWRRHYNFDKYLRTTIKETFPFLEWWVDKVEDRLMGCLFVTMPGNVSNMDVAAYMLRRHEIEIGTGWGPTKGKVIRLALLGPNAKAPTAERVVSALTETFNHFGLGSNKCVR